MTYDRKALIVGIDYYQSARQLKGCVSDAHSVEAVLATHANGRGNFTQPELMTGTGAVSPVNKLTMRRAIKENFDGDPEIAIFYFAGHGHVNEEGGYLMCSDSAAGEDGLPLSEVATMARNSNAKNKIIVLDCCHSGVAGATDFDSTISNLREGLTILTASTAGQYAIESNGSGVFTRLFVDALNGSASNLLGQVTPASVYAHIDQSLGPKAQRPVFKTNVKAFVCLREVVPPIELDELQKIDSLFLHAGYEHDLNPSYEPERSGSEPAGTPLPNPDNVAKFAILQKYNRVNLVVPVGAPHMWHAAMQSKSCELTALGEHYRELREKRLI